MMDVSVCSFHMETVTEEKRPVNSEEAHQSELNLRE